MTGSHSCLSPRHLGWLQDSTLVCWFRRARVPRAAAPRSPRLVRRPLRVYQAPQVAAALSQRGSQQGSACLWLQVTRLPQAASFQRLGFPLMLNLAALPIQVYFLLGTTVRYTGLSHQNKDYPNGPTGQHMSPVQKFPLVNSLVQLS